MKALVLAAGEGTRLRPLTDDTPKPLVEVGGKPLLTRCLETVAALGIDEAVVVVGYRAGQIESRYGDSFGGLALEYAHQAERTGLAHAVLAAGDHVDGDVAVLNGDNVYAGNLGAAVDRHRETGADVTIPVERVSRERASAGAVCVTDDDGRVVGLVEKPDDPPSLSAPAGFYVLPPEIVPACEVVRPSARGEYELPDAVDLLLHAGYDVETVPFEGWRLNVNTPADVRRAERRLAGSDATDSR